MAIKNFRRFRTSVKFGLLAGCSLISLSAMAQEAAPAADEEITTVTVLGSNIPRTQKEGPAPVTVIDAEAIRAGGYANVPDLLRTVTQNGGETQSQQSGNAADFSPGAQQVNLRGLGPNHTLVMINGRRIADYPMPYNGESNFTDVSNIPLGMIERVEILAGSASAIYGSDAIAGVVNFKLKKKVDGTTVDYRYGWTEDGGGKSNRLNLSTGYSKDKFSAVFGGEYAKQDPVYAYERARQDSTTDAPDAAYQMPNYNWLRTDDYDDSINPTEAQCNLTAATNEGTTVRAYDDYYNYYGDGGYYCGSDRSIAYRTIVSDRESFNGYAALSYQLTDRIELFTDIQFGISELKLLKRPLSWSYQDATGDDTGLFYNSFDDRYDNWYRIFTPEEMGGLQNAMRKVDSKTLTVTPGVRGSFGTDWNYEVALNASIYQSEISFPMVVVDAANALYLGAQQGTDADGYAIFNADPTRYYTPLTPAEFKSITATSLYKPKAWTSELTARINKTELFSLPAGPVGFAAVAEYGRQGYNLNPDPKALAPYYFSWVDSDGKGGRTHYALGGEISAPLLENLQLGLAARYDNYSFAGSEFGETTYNAGLEYRPLKTLLIRAAYGTGFRAPDLHYVYSGPGFVEGRVPDYYTCFSDDPTTDPSDCDTTRVSVRRDGNRDLKPETSKSFNTGIVWAPSSMFDISLDYFKVEMSNQVEDLDTEGVVRNEAECRLGQQDITSPTCQDAIARVVRYTTGAQAGDIRTLLINPINVANEETDGIDVAVRVKFDTPIGKLSMSGSHTHTFVHDYQRFDGDDYLNKFAADSSYYIPRDKSSLSTSLATGAWKFTVDGTWLGKLPNYDEDAYVKGYYLWNGSVQYDINDQAKVSLAITNLFDEQPIRDATWTGYPYYNANWYDGIGRSGFLQLTYKFK
jgi:outer membrane receptor protein involved in Fe transport